MEVNAGYFTIYDGGSENAGIIGNLKESNDTKISTPRNQIFVVLNTNGNDSLKIRLNAGIIEGK